VFDEAVFDEAVAVGIAAYMGTGGGDAEVRSELDRRGVEPWLAERLVTFLPLAFGRRVLAGVQFSDVFLDGGTQRPLAGEPVYTAASERAQRAIRAEVERIGLRGSEVNAVNNALNGGAALDDLVLGPPALPSPLPAVAPGDGGVPSPRAAFLAFLAGHGFTVRGQHLGGTAFDAQVYPQPSSRPEFICAQVDFRVRDPRLAGGLLVDSHAGFGGTWREAINQAIAKFERASLHPIIAALVDRSAAADQVSWERYDHPAGRYDFCLGPQLVMFAQSPARPAAELVDRILAALRAERLSREIHSLRVFTYHDNGALRTNEVLLDGQPWPAGEAVIGSAPAPVPDGPVAARLFGLAVPAH